METNRIIQVCGSVIKKESIVLLNVNVLDNTCVAEANKPYSNYYGIIPENPVPNSLFLFTIPFYTLEEVLRFVQKSDSCFKEKMNVATAILNLGQELYPAIRIKNFPDYEHLPELQKCFANEGVQFKRNVPVAEEAVVKIQKCFVLKEVENGIYLDLQEENKGYLLVDMLLNEEEFSELVNAIRYNTNCRLFDAAKCGIILDSEIKEMIRIFSEKLDLALLQCVQKDMQKFLKRIN